MEVQNSREADERRSAGRAGTETELMEPATTEKMRTILPSEPFLFGTHARFRGDFGPGGAARRLQPFHFSSAASAAESAQN
jgi:hypothetical protein